ncbi:MAG: sugar ABC transporter substrate-binding protein [Bacteroidota bacterium]
MKIILQIFFSVAIFLSFNCNHSSDEVSTIKFWGFGAEGEKVKLLIEQFEKENPSIKVKVQQIPWTSAHEKLLTAFAGNSLPDVCQLGNTWIPEFVTLKSLENLNSLLLKSSIKEENYFSGIFETNKIDSGLYGLPWYIDTRVLFYRKDLFDSIGWKSPPKNWDELKRVSILLKNKYPKSYPIFLPANEWNPQIIFGMQNGSSFLKNNNSFGNFSEEKYKTAFSFYKYFYENNLSPVGMSQVSNVYQAFTEGFIMMYITGPWNIGEFQKRIPQDKQHIWMTAAMPSTDSIYPGASLAGGSSLVLFKSSKNKIASWKLIEFLTSKKQQLKFYTQTGNLPSNRDAWNDSILINNIYTKAFRLQLENLISTPKVPEWENIAMKVQKSGEAVSVKQSSITEILFNLDNDVNRILEKRRSLLIKNKK